MKTRFLLFTVIAALLFQVRADADTSAAGSLPMLWKGVDIGAVGVAGSSSDTAGTYTVIGSGADVWGAADACQFASMNFAGDVEIKAHVVSQTNPNAWAKAGVMMRDGTGAGAVNVFVALTPGNGTVFQTRSTVGGSTVISGSTATSFNWVRLVRAGSVFTAYASSDGTTWTVLGSAQTVSMAGTISVGLAVTSHNNAAISTAVFDNMSAAPWWQTKDIGTGLAAGSVTNANGTFTFNGAGTLANSSRTDNFRYYYQMMGGTTGQVVARISTLGNTSGARVGVMIRSGTANNSLYAFMGVSQTGAYEFQARSTSGGRSSTTTPGTSGVTPNVWVKLVRSGNTFTGFTSSDGLTWTQAGTATITMTTAYIGLADASGATNTLNTSIFDNVGGGSITGLPMQTQLNSFEDAGQLASLQDNAICSLSTQHATDGAHSLQVTFPYYGNSIEYPGVIFPAGSLFTPTDWSHAGAFMFDAYNADSVPLKVCVRFYDSNGNASDTTITLPPGVQQRVSVGIHLPFNVLMDGYPLSQACNADQGGMLPAWAGFVGTSVTQILFFLDNPGRAQTAYFDNFTLTDIIPPCNIVDQYGQYIQQDWPGKIHSDAEIVTAHTTEAAALAAQLAALSATTDRDTYGGWATGPTVNATGWFRTQKLNGKWWLVTPTGHLFWSTGIDNINPGTGCVLDDTNRLYFSWIPSAASNDFDPWGIDFYNINLVRSYGSGYLASWKTNTANRLKAWGFNTLAAWCDPVNVMGQLPQPFTVALSDGSGPAFDGGSGSISDFYSSAWKTDAETQISTGINDGIHVWNTNPLCIGYFVNNEAPPWAGPDYLPVNALALPGTWAVKAAFTTLLQTKYGSANTNALNAAWGFTAATSWANFLANPVTGFPAVGSRNAALEADLSMLLSEFANQYFSTVNTLVKKYAPNQLYLGCRFAGTQPDEVALAAGASCDVVAYNAYGLGVPHYGDNPLQARSAQIMKFDKPAIIGEFSFGSTDRGVFSGGVLVDNQQQRAVQYAAYVNSALSMPWCVGVHWFQYVDEMIIGRGDGENANEGLVAMTDTPYPELTAQAAATNAAMYSTRAAVAATNPAVITPSAVTGSSAILTVSGGDLSGSAAVTYTWSTTGTPPGTVTFTPNGSGAAQVTAMTFSQPGMYHVLVTIADPAGHLDTATLNLSPDVWTNASGGSWSNSANWSGGVVAGGTDAFAIFSTLNLSSDGIVTLDGPVTVGNLLFADSTPSNNWFLNAGSGGPLTLSVSMGTPMISVTNQTATIGAVIAGSQGLIKSGVGTLVFSGSNTYTGPTTVLAGTLSAGAAMSAFGSNSAMTLSNSPGVTLDLNGFSNTVGSLSGGGAVGGNVTLGSAILTAGGDNSSTSFAGSISGSGGITKSGTGTWTLTGSNTYTGPTTVNTGILQAGVAGSAFGVNSAVTLANAAGATLDLNGYAHTLGSLSGGGASGGRVTLGSALLTTGADDSSTSFAGVISGGDVTKTGTGTWTISGNNSLGSLIANNGTLVINGGATTAGGTVSLQGNNAAMLIQSGSLTLNGGWLGTEASGSSVLGMTGGLLYVINGWSDGHSIGNFGTTAALNLSGSSAMTVVGSLNIGTRAATSVSVGGNASLTLDGFSFGWQSNGLEAGGSSLTVSGSGRVHFNQRFALNGGSGWNGAETINLNGGTLQTVAPDRANTGGMILWNFNGGTLLINGTGSGSGSLGNFLAGVDTATVGSGGAVVDTNGYNITLANALLSGTASDGGLTKLGSGTLTLTGACSYNGPTTVSQGALQLLGSIASGGGVTVSAAATLGGTGSVGGPVTVKGFLAPGTGSIGSITVSNVLTLSGTATLRISKSGSVLSNDSVIGLSGVSYGGALVISNIGSGSLAAGDTFMLFTAGSYNGAFSNISLPSLTGNLVWNTSNLPVNGSISVTVSPVLTTIGVSPATVTLASGSTQQFTATAYDQFGSPMAGQPAFTWGCTGVGSVNSSGFYTASNTSGSATVTASSASIQGSAVVTVLPPPPAAPAGFTATAGNGQVALSWSASSGATGYNVKRSTLSGSNYTIIVPNTVATSYNDTGVTNWTTYYYVVSAINAGGEGMNSAQAAAQPQSPPISAAEKGASSKISLSGSDGTLTFTSSVEGHTYQLQYIDSLTNGTWSNFGPAQPGTGGDLILAVPYDNSVPRRFYRLQIRQ
jgi:autotransporter-associated beta strand protein